MSHANPIGPTRRVRLHLAVRCLATALGIVAVIAAMRAPQTAHATFHFAVIDEAMFGANGDPNIQYVEIKMTNVGQNLTAHTRLSAWNADGSFFGVLLELPAAVPNNGTNVRYVMGTTAFEAASGITPDFTFAPVSLPSTGMICWGAPGLVAPNPPLWSASDPLQYVDCIPYNGYSNANIRFPTASPFGLGDGNTQSLTRVSQTNNTSVDFALACPSPQTNFGVIGFNHDGNFSDNSPPYVQAVDDKTIVNSDNVGDNCGDTDDDNDGISDTTETNLVTLQGICPTASAITDPLKLDSDGDHITDGAECVMGSDPANILSKPAIPPAAQDTDHDQLSNTFEGTLGTSPTMSDSDGDGVPDGVEYKGHGSNPLAIDTDGDGIRDRCEVASLNADTIVNSGDQAQLATEIQRFVPQASKLADFDLNKDTVLNAGDQVLLATGIGPTKCP